MDAEMIESNPIRKHYVVTTHSVAGWLHFHSHRIALQRAVFDDYMLKSAKKEKNTKLP